MCENKVYKVKFLVEREYTAENPKVRIHLSLVRENIWKETVWSKSKGCCKWVIHMIIRILLSAVVALPFGAWAIHFAYAERGYVAYGGEYLLISMVFLTTFEALGLKK